MIGHILGWIIAGLIVGAIARLLMPGRQALGIGMTIVIGIVGAVLGGFLSWLIFGNPGDQFTVEQAWPGWLMSIVGAFVVLWAFLAATGARPTRTTL